MADAPPPMPATDMVAYYRQRAAYYERVYHFPERQAELRAIEAALPALFAGRRVLEIATGTGWWTPHAARDAADWLATDINPETLAVARTKPMPACVRWAAVDGHALDDAGGVLGDARFDAAFAGCWWSHVPLQQLDGWLAQLHRRLLPGARVVVLDNRVTRHPTVRRDAQGNTYQHRALDDGSVHEVLKNFPTRDEAIARLGPRARQPEWTAHTHYWLLHYTLA